MKVKDNEWTIIGNGNVIYHDDDETRTRQRLESLKQNYKATAWEIHLPKNRRSVYTIDPTLVANVADIANHLVIRRIICRRSDSIHVAKCH